MKERQKAFIAVYFKVFDDWGRQIMDIYILWIKMLQTKIDTKVAGSAKSVGNHYSHYRQ